ncbi:MAG TPA: ABC transporter permease [Eggerthellaceae bacterium]|nr:ABC transporter permease [Eggerthellaceae bacterium]
MIRFILRNIVRLALLLLAVSAVAFFLIAVSPIDPVQANVGQSAWISMSEAKRAQLAEHWGVGTPIWERYAHWLGSALQGDFGTSLRYNAPVADVIAWRAGNTLLLMAVAWAVSGVLGFALGVVAGVNRGSAVDKAVKAYCFVLAATPTFWLGLVFLMAFAVALGWFPIGFSVPVGKAAADVTILDALHHMVLPAITLSVVGVAQIALHTREKTIDVMESDYVRFARARGLGMWATLRRHGLRNLALPAITLQFASLAEIFGGSVLVEQVFSYPGLGQAAVTAAMGGDAALLCAIAVVSSALVFCGNLVANVLYGAIDPRMRTGEVARG